MPSKFDKFKIYQTGLPDVDGEYNRGPYHIYGNHLNGLTFLVLIADDSMYILQLVIKIIWILGLIARMLEVLRMSFGLEPMMGQDYWKDPELQ